VSDPLNPSTRLLCKLGSIAVHVDEAIGCGGHEFDVIAIRQLVEDNEVLEWIREMGALGLVPAVRSKDSQTRNVAENYPCPENEK